MGRGERQKNGSSKTPGSLPGGEGSRRWLLLRVALFLNFPGLPSLARLSVHHLWIVKRPCLSPVGEFGILLAQWVGSLSHAFCLAGLHFLTLTFGSLSAARCGALQRQRWMWGKRKTNKVLIAGKTNKGSQKLPCKTVVLQTGGHLGQSPSASLWPSTGGLLEQCCWLAVVPAFSHVCCQPYLPIMWPANSH